MLLLIHFYFLTYLHTYLKKMKNNVDCGSWFWTKEEQSHTKKYVIFIQRKKLFSSKKKVSYIHSNEKLIFL